MKFKSLKRSIATCQLCESKYEVEMYRIGRTKYCSFTCKQKAASRASGIVIAAKTRGTGKAYVKVGGQHEHRRVMEEFLGRKLLRSEVVHHKDRNKKNNDISNLEICNQSDHAKEHFDEMMAARKIKHGY